MSTREAYQGYVRRTIGPLLGEVKTTATPGYLAFTAAGVPSSDALSTTIAGRSGSSVSRPTVRHSSSTRFLVAITTVTLASAWSLVTGVAFPGQGS